MNEKSYYMNLKKKLDNIFFLSVILLYLLEGKKNLLSNRGYLGFTIQWKPLNVITDNVVIP